MLRIVGPACAGFVLAAAASVVVLGPRVAQAQETGAGSSARDEHLRASWFELSERARWVDYDVREHKLVTGFCHWDELADLESAIARAWTASRGSDTLTSEVASELVAWRTGTAARPDHFDFEGFTADMEFHLRIRGDSRRYDQALQDDAYIQNLITPTAGATLAVLQNNAPTVTISGPMPRGSSGILNAWPWQMFAHTGFDRLLVDPAGLVAASLGDAQFRRAVRAADESVRFNSQMTLPTDGRTQLHTTSVHARDRAYLPVEAVQEGRIGGAVTRRARVWLGYDDAALPLPREVVSLRCERVATSGTDPAVGTLAQVSVYAWSVEGLTYVAASSEADLRLLVPPGTRIVDQSAQHHMEARTEDLERWPELWAELLEPPPEFADAVARIRAGERPATADVLVHGKPEPPEAEPDSEEGGAGGMLWVGVLLIGVGLVLVASRRVTVAGKEARS